MRIVLDLDGVICALKKPNETYLEVQPNEDVISKMREWKKDGHEKWMEDLQLIMQWMENDTAAMDSEIYNKRLER